MPFDRELPQHALTLKIDLIDRGWGLAASQVATRSNPQKSSHKRRVAGNGNCSTGLVGQRHLHRAARVAVVEDKTIIVQYPIVVWKRQTTPDPKDLGAATAEQNNRGPRAWQPARGQGWNGVPNSS